jgi:hypothetical protein
VAGHEEGDCGVGDALGFRAELVQVVARLVLVAEVGDHIDYATLVRYRDIPAKHDVGQEKESDDRLVD